MSPETPNVRPVGHVDLLEMARFLVLPGAVQLLEAFARIPPGPLRDSVISHAEVISRTYTSAPVEQQMPDPLTMAARAAPPPVAKALPRPHRRPQNQEEEIIRLRLEGLNKRQISEQTGAPRQAIEATIKAARRARVIFPPVKTPEVSVGRVQFTTRMEDLTPQGRHNMESAAMRAGHSLQSWLDARQTLVNMRLALKPMDEIMAAIHPRLPEKTLWGWLYNARSAGIELPLEVGYEDAEVEPVVEPQAARKAAQKARGGPKPGSVVPAPGRPVFTPLDQLVGKSGSGALASIVKASAARNLTPQGMFDLREAIVLHRYSGKGSTEIFSLVGQDMDFIRNAIANAKEKGVLFPPVTSDFDANAWTKAKAAGKRIVAARKNLRKANQAFPLTIEDATPGIIASIRREGLKEGQTLEAYFDLRRRAVEMFIGKATNGQIMTELGLTNRTVQNWRDRSRSAGLWGQMAAE